jgi:hypothetical protein
MNPSAIRQGLRAVTRAQDQASGTASSAPAQIYVPPSHARALDPNATIVEGIRGAGKSFWCAQLASSAHFDFVVNAFPEANLGPKIKMVRGFGLGPGEAPSPRVLASLVSMFPADSIWRAVLAVHAGFPGAFAQFTQWQERVQWVHSNPEQFDVLLDEADRGLFERGETLVVLFDALDRLASEWAGVVPLARSLLQIALEVRGTRRIRFKVFVRPDMLENAGIVSFPDFSKLVAGKASLEWRRADLYALLYQALANAGAAPGVDDAGGAFRSAVEAVTSLQTEQRAQAWTLPSRLRTDERLQERLFESMAGPAMGANTKRGKPYSWLVNHLLDGLNQVSPRSFFAALHEAAIGTDEVFPLPLDYRAIQVGVQKASRIRVAEVEEDYAWVKTVMEPLRTAITVPCVVQDFDRIWTEVDVFTRVQGRPEGSDFEGTLPPFGLSRKTAGLLDDLEKIGLIHRLKDGRIQMPDVYRIAFGLGRRGGVKPLQ